MKVYTGGGDKGQTSLFSGERVAKHHARIEAYGDLDELCSFQGVIAAQLPEAETGLATDFLGIQLALFAAGAWLATTPGAPAEKHLMPFADDMASGLERRIDAISETLPELNPLSCPAAVRQSRGPT